jgi:uncharacterized Tic20 family protein
MNPFFVFGMINLIMAIITYPLLKKEVNNPHCDDEIKSVKINKISIIIYFTISLIVTLIGAILFFI